MELFYSSILGIVQGITELLPISSSGHLIIFSDIFEKDPTQSFLTALHLASALALLLLYWNLIVEIIKSDERYDFLKKLAIAATPVVIVGVLFGDLIEEYLYSYQFIALNLIFWGIVMIITEKFEAKFRKEGDNDISTQNAIVIGLFQILSLLPGTSRSGITTLAGIWSGAAKDKALDFSFIMGIPLLFGAFFFSTLKNGDNLRSSIDVNFIFAFIFAFICSYLAALLLRKISKRKFLTLFGIYRIFLGLGIFLLFSYYL